MIYFLLIYFFFNRIRRIEGLSNATKLEVLDLHGNRITQANGLRGLNELKVLNLAGNQLRTVELLGLPELRELNLKRNRLRKLTGCDGVPKIQKMFLNNNDLQRFLFSMILFCSHVY